MKLEDLRLFLPKYLSGNSEKALIKSIQDFPNNSNRSFYTEYLKNEPTIFQGDGLSNMVVFNVPHDPNEPISRKESNVIVYSNTCDLDQNNNRFFPSNIVYSPIIPLSSYQKVLLSERFEEKRILSHFASCSSCSSDLSLLYCL